MDKEIEFTSDLPLEKRLELVETLVFDTREALRVLAIIMAENSTSMELPEYINSFIKNLEEIPKELFEEMKKEIQGE